MYSGHENACVCRIFFVPFIPRGNSGTSHSELGSQWQIAFVVADFAKGFRHAGIKRSIAPPLPIRAKLFGDPDKISGRPRPLLSPFEHSSLGTPYEKIANEFAHPKNSSYLCRRIWIYPPFEVALNHIAHVM